MGSCSCIEFDLGQRRPTTTRAKQKGRIGEASNPGPQCTEKEKKNIVVQQVNITQLDKNGHHIVANEADIVGLAEIKLAAKKIGPWKKIFLDAKKKLVCGPSNNNKKVPQAGVGIVGGPKVRLIEAQIKTLFSKESLMREEPSNHTQNVDGRITWCSMKCIWKQATQHKQKHTTKL